MKQPLYQKVLAAAALIVAMALLIAGSVRQHKVYEPAAEEFGLVAFQRITDRELVIDTTFGGAIRKGLKLYSTYDRSKPRGKKACPT